MTLCFYNNFVSQVITNWNFQNWEIRIIWLLIKIVKNIIYIICTYDKIGPPTLRVCNNIQNKIKMETVRLGTSKLKFQTPILMPTYEHKNVTSVSTLALKINDIIL